METKTNKALQTENSDLTFKLNNLKQNFDKLSAEHKILQTELISEKEKTKVKCNKCKVNLENVTNVKKHKNVQKAKTMIFKCEKCEKEFYEEWKLRAHVKIHNKIKCEQCEKTFANSDIKEKHVRIAHENVKLYCHFYNNEKSCPFADKCIFLHQHSKFCKYDELCERDLCMFKHKKNNVPLNSDDCVDQNDDDKQDDFEDEEEESEIDEEDTANKTFINPTQVGNIDCIIKCEICDFEASTRSEFDNHKTRSHNWCSLCFSSFISQERLKKHLKNKHNKQ